MMIEAGVTGARATSRPQRSVEQRIHILDPRQRERFLVLRQQIGRGSVGCRGLCVIGGHRPALIDIAGAVVVGQRFRAAPLLAAGAVVELGQHLLHGLDLTQLAERADQAQAMTRIFRQPRFEPLAGSGKAAVGDIDIGLADRRIARLGLCDILLRAAAPPAALDTPQKLPRRPVAWRYRELDVRLGSVAFHLVFAHMRYLGPGAATLPQQGPQQCEYRQRAEQRRPGHGTLP
ncbi:hypothetical protein QO259_10800 [Salinicola sp. JS01]|uniref:hypothetical protein n=1 Tax=Salinicola sp. JS01 TaxID=3050071 RepID=UPI00255B9DD9|nr:hypothetical protein [Salinicola sp. JS01]WIX31321.1 hypothetical protein QO259_10800 [Salinicola sp. JS01]